MVAPNNKLVGIASSAQAREVKLDPTINKKWEGGYKGTPTKKRPQVQFTVPFLNLVWVSAHVQPVKYQCVCVCVCVCVYIN